MLQEELDFSVGCDEVLKDDGHYETVAVSVVLYVRAMGPATDLTLRQRDIFL